MLQGLEGDLACNLCNFLFERLINVTYRSIAGETMLL